MTLLLILTLVNKTAFSAEPEPAAATKSTPPTGAGLKLAVFPASIDLTTARDYQTFIATVTRTDDVTIDVTTKANWTLTTEEFCRIEGNQLFPISDGEAELICDYAGKQIRVPIKVEHSAEKLPLSFEKDIVPILTRSGCNTGSCHGAARGKDGFMISLFGYDPNGDYHRVTREIGMRRINLAVPQESLFLTKAVGKVPHSGGKLFGADSVYYEMILEWLRDERSSR